MINIKGREHHMRKSKTFKISIAASAIIAATPLTQADAATNVNQLVINAQNASTILKWAISVEGFADFKTKPYEEYNTTKKYIEAAEKAAASLSSSKRLSVQASLVDAKVQVKRAQAYIDAITSSEKIKVLTSNVQQAISSGNLDDIETAYHGASEEYRKQAKLLDRVYGQSTRDGIRNSVKPTFEHLIQSIRYDVTVHMHIKKAEQLSKENKYIEADLELMKAHQYLTDFENNHRFHSKLVNKYEAVEDAIPMLPLFATPEGQHTVTLKLSKAMDHNVNHLEPGQFIIPGEIIQQAKLSDDRKSIKLSTSELESATDYTLRWKGHSVQFTTPSVEDTSGISLTDLKDQYLETTDTRVYIAKFTNGDGSPYNGRVKINLAQPNGEATTAIITSFNGQVNTGSQEWSHYADQNGHVVFTVRASSGEATSVQPTIQKLDGNQTSKKAAITYFHQLQPNTGEYNLKLENAPIHKNSNFIVVNGIKYKWDMNDLFFIHGQIVSVDEFVAALTEGDMLTIGYNLHPKDISTWNIISDITRYAPVTIKNPVKSSVTFDGSYYEISGTAEPGNKVKVYRNGAYVGMVTVDKGGNWTVGTVSLLQNIENTFVAYQYGPGQDGIDGTGSVDQANATIKEGAFASTSITYHDEGSKGISIMDTLDFQFINPSFNHTFKTKISGTITINDGFGRSVEVRVDYVDEDTLKIVDFVSRDDNFSFDASVFVITSTSGIVNQDQLEYSVKASKLDGTILRDSSK